MKALALFSGGLDSLLAVEVTRKAGAAVEGIHFINPFHQNRDHTVVSDAAAQIGLQLHLWELSDDYLDVIAHPPHGYGKWMNPCIDCRIHQLKLARQQMETFGASFLITGEVLDQRPNSQRRDALDIVERDSQTRGILVRPLSAKHLRPTLPELKGWVDRDKLLDIKGRGRSQQIELAARFGITHYPAPAGGCLLTSKEYSAKIADLLSHGVELNPHNLELLRYGRHLRLSDDVKLIVGRDHTENDTLTALAKATEILLELPEYAGPVTLYSGPVSESMLTLAAMITAGYSKVPDHAEVSVAVHQNGQEKRLAVQALSRETIKSYFIPV